VVGLMRWRVECWLRLLERRGRFVRRGRVPTLFSRGVSDGAGGGSSLERDRERGADAHRSPRESSLPAWRRPESASGTGSMSLLHHRGLARRRRGRTRGRTRGTTSVGGCGTGVSTVSEVRSSCGTSAVGARAREGGGEAGFPVDVDEIIASTRLSWFECSRAVFMSASESTSTQQRHSSSESRCRSLRPLVDVRLPRHPLCRTSSRRSFACSPALHESTRTPPPSRPPPSRPSAATRSSPALSSSPIDLERRRR